MGTCPKCHDEFYLQDATLFAIGSEAPLVAADAIRNVRARLKDQKIALAKARERMTTRAKRTAQAVNLGKIVEKIVPSFATFSYTPGDCRALFEPVDYLIFSGLVGRGTVDALYFVDVKSGRARLTSVQECIRECVASGSVKFSISAS